MVLMDQSIDSPEPIIVPTGEPRVCIIKRGEKGFGFKVSGNNPVFIEEVKKDGPADQANCRPNDVIIKVNDNNVLGKKHKDVVDMMKNSNLIKLVVRSGIRQVNCATTDHQPTGQHHRLHYNHSTSSQSRIITGPQPLKDVFKQAYDATNVTYLKDILKKTIEQLEKAKLQKDKKQIEAATKHIKALEEKLEHLESQQTKQRNRHASMSAENLSFNDDDSESTNSQTKKSHSFGQYDQSNRATIMAMDSDDENDLTNNNSCSHHLMIHQNAITIPIPNYIGEIPEYSIRMTKWLLSQQCSPNAVLFYTIAGHVFPRLALATTSKKLITKLAWQIECTWLLPDISPLFFQKFPQELIYQLESALDSFNSDPSSSFNQESLLTIFNPFISLSQGILQKHINDWKEAAKIGLVPIPLNSVKDELTEITSMLLNIQPSTIEQSSIDNIIQYTNPQNVVPIAIFSCLSTIAHHIFAQNTPIQHHLLSPIDSSLSPQSYNPILRLSLDHSSSGKKHKRNSSLPAHQRTLSPGANGITQSGHQFLGDITKIQYCSGCQLVIWGSFGHICSHCKMCVHIWCLKKTAAESPCPGPAEGNEKPTESSSSLRGGKNRRWKSSSSGRIPLLERIKKTTGIAQSHPIPLLSSTSSDDDDDDDEILQNFRMNDLNLPTTTTTTTSSGITTNVLGSNDAISQGQNVDSQSNQSQGIQRSESFRQRRSSRPDRNSYRKRSDPSLKSTNKHTINFSTTTCPPNSDSTSSTLTTINMTTIDSSGQSRSFSSDTLINANNVPVTGWGSSDDEDDEPGKDTGSGNSPNQTQTTSPNLTSPNLVSSPTFNDDTPPPLPPRPVSEKRRQIHAELVETEENHVYKLYHLRELFYRPMISEGLLNEKEIGLIFLNSKNLLKIHKKIRNKMKLSTEQGQSLERTVYEIFCGQIGSNLEREASYFCANQKFGKDILKDRKKKDSKLKSFLDTIFETRAKEMPGSEMARLSLEDLLASIFQRPGKYPLIFDRLKNATPSDSQEYELLDKVVTRCKDIMTNINNAVREAESKRRLAEIVKKMEKPQNISLDFDGHSLIHEGLLTWRQPKQRCLDVWVVLTDRMLVILNYSKDSDRYYLKPHSISSSQPNNKRENDGQFPIISFDELKEDPNSDFVTRDVATDANAFFIVSTSKIMTLFIELSASSMKERMEWTQAITRVVNDIKYKNRIQTTSKLMDLTLQRDEQFKNLDHFKSQASTSQDDDDKIINNEEEGKGNDEDEGEAISELQRAETATPTSASKQGRNEGVIRYVREDELHPPDLISPSRVTVSPEPIVLEASPRIQIAEIDSKISKLIDVKKRLIGQMQGLDKWEWNVVCDLARHDDDNNTSRDQVTFLDKAMSLVTTLALNGLTRDIRDPLKELRDQIDLLVDKVEADHSQQVQAQDEPDDGLQEGLLQDEAIGGDDLSQSYCSAQEDADISTDNAAVYF